MRETVQVSEKSKTGEMFDSFYHSDDRSVSEAAGQSSHFRFQRGRVNFQYSLRNYRVFVAVQTLFEQEVQVGLCQEICKRKEEEVWILDP